MTPPKTIPFFAEINREINQDTITVLESMLLKLKELRNETDKKPIARD